MPERRYKQEIERFEARSDDGETIVVIIRQTMVETQTSSGTSTSRGSIDAIASNGEDLNFGDSDNKVFERLGDDKIFRRA